ncbi:MAG: hypothetical protein WKF87_07990 [Chryseolinea sp.]
MTVENVVKKIRRELIRSVSRIDAWFDRDSALLDYRSATTTKTITELLAQAMLTNRFIVQIIDEGHINNIKGNMNGMPVADYCAKIQELENLNTSPVDFDSSPSLEDSIDLNEIRYEIREQLHRCLIHLENLFDAENEPFETNLAVGELGKLDAYQCIYFLALHVRRYLEQLDSTLSDYNRYAEEV